MRYFLRDGAFVIRGTFTAIMSGAQNGAWEERGVRISTIIATHLHHTSTKEGSQSFFHKILQKNGYDTHAVGLHVTTSIDNFRVFAYDGIMVFIHSQPVGPNDQPGPVTVIINSREPLSEEGLKALLQTAKDARNQAFVSGGFSETDPEAHPILICCEEMNELPNDHERIKRAQQLVSETITYGIPKTCAPHETESVRRPPFYIHSSIGGERWTLWNPEGCPYYPCHLSSKEQRCDFCYCPLYPCADESLGKWLERENGGRIWSCEGCTLVHEPAVADYLILHPEASAEDLKDIRKKEMN